MFELVIFLTIRQSNKRSSCYARSNHYGQILCKFR